MHKLSVIIVNYNVKHFLEQALLSVEKAIAHVDSEVWVVDNCSVDGSVEMVAEKFPWVKMMANKDNVGFSRANNQAVRASNSEYVLLLNPDTLVSEDTFKKCVDYMDAHANVGGLGVRMIDGKGKFLPESKRGLPTPSVAFYKMTGLATIFSKSRKFGRYHLKYLSEYETHEVEVLSGAYMLMRSSCLDKVGLLDEDFFMYGEDIDLSYRILKGGYKNVYFADTTIIHYKGESTKKRSANYVKVFYNAMVLFAEKHYSSRMAGWFSALINIAIYLRAGLAFGVRVAQKLWLPLLDLLLIVAGFASIAWYWELYNKYVHGFYPVDYYQVHMPIYALFMMAFVYVSGGYDEPVSARRLLRGSVVGAIGLYAVYAFLPKDYQFSRAILALGSFWAIAAFFILRFLAKFFGLSQFLLDEDNKRKVILVGDEDECNRIAGLLQKTRVYTEIVGRVSSGRELHQQGFVGSIEQLAEVVSVYRANLIIFSGKDVSSSEIIQQMGQFQDWEVQVKIAPEKSESIIGSDSKNEPGELFTVEVKYHLSQPHTIRKKRIMDLLIALMCLVLSPILILKKTGRLYLANWLAVVFGLKTWVGYSLPESGKSALPRLKKYVLEASGRFHQTNFEWDACLNYAKDYEPLMDLELVWNRIWHKQ